MGDSHWEQINEVDADRVIVYVDQNGDEHRTYLTATRYLPQSEPADGYCGD